MKKFFRRALLIAAAFTAFVVIAFVIVVSIGIRVDLDPLRAPVQAIASTALGREVRMDGPMTLVPTWSPTLEIQGLRIGNPEGWPSAEFAHMDLARIRLGVFPVFLGRAVIREFTAEGVSVLLEQTHDGRINWLLALEEPVADVEPSDTPTEAPPFDPRKFFIRSAAIEKLSLNDIAVEYRDAVADSQSKFEVGSLHGVLGTHEPLRVQLAGNYAGEGYELTVSGGPPVDLVNSETPWPLELVLEIADTKMRLKTVIEEPLTLGLVGGGGNDAEVLGRRFGKVEVSANAEQLESLERLVGADLPPWGPYGISGVFEAFEGGRLKGKVEVDIGTSALHGTLEVMPGDPRSLDMTLTASSLQLDDFETKGWNPTQEQPPPEQRVTEEEAIASHEAGDRKAAILSPEILRRANGSLTVSVDRVTSGEDHLGKGHFTLTLEAGRLRLEPFELEVPGGNARLHLVFYPTADGVHTTFSANVDRLDYGILARRIDPNAKMSGLVRLDIAIEANSPAARGLMGYANGRVDLAVFPENLDAGLVDLWAANLVAAAASAVDSSEQSRLNCLVGQFDLENGVMREQTLMLDTSNMSVGGSVEVDFTRRHLKVRLVPKAKNPEFFSAATPVRIEGSFADFGIGVKITDVLRSVVSMGTSVIHVPVRRIFFTAEEKDDLDECLAALRRVPAT